MKNFLLAAALSAPAWGQVQNAPDQYAIGFPGSNPGVAAERIVSGSFDSTSVIDFAVLSFGDITVAFDASLGEASTTITGNFEDIASHSPDGSSLTASLYAVGQDGLQRLDWDDASGTFLRTDVFDDATAGAARTAWMGATRLRTGDLNGDAYLDLVGVASDTHTLLVAEGTASGFAPSSYTATAAGEVLDLEVLDFTGDGTGEVVTLSTTGLSAFDNSGALMQFYPHAATRGEIERITSVGSSDHDLAWLAEMPTGAWFLFVLDMGTFTTQQILDVSAKTPRRMKGGDHDGNGTTDLVFTNRIGNEINILKHTGTGYALDAANTETILSTRAPILPAASDVEVVDLDCDGDLDIVAPILDQGFVFLAKNDLVDHASLAPHFLSGGNYNELYLLSRPDYDRLGIRLELGQFAQSGLTQNPMATHTYPAGATDIEIRIWNSIQQTDGSFVTAPTPAESYRLSLTDGDSLVFYPSPDFLTVFEAELPVFESPMTDGDMHFITCRYIQRVGNLIVKGWPFNSIWIMKPGNTAAVSFLQTFEFTTAGTDLGTNAALHDQGGTGGSQAGDVGSTGCVPGFPPSSPPKEPEPKKPGS